MRQVLRSLDDLAAVREEWNALADLRGHALLRHEWFTAAVRTFYSERDVFVVLHRDGGGVRALAPLVHRRIAGVERLELIGAGVLHEPSGLLYRDLSCRDDIVIDLLHLGKPVILQQVSVDELGSQLIRAARARGIAIVKTTGGSLGVALNGSEILERLPGKLRYDVRRARSRAGRYGPVMLEALRPREDDSDTALDHFIAVECSGWKGRNASSLAANKRLQSFFRDYCALAAREEALRVFFLKVGGRIAAAQVSVEYYNRLWVLKIGYDEGLARCSPGFLLTALAIGHASGRGLASYEFLGGTEEWEKRWRPELRPSALFMFYPWNLRGCAGVSLDAACAAWRRVRQDSVLTARTAYSRPGDDMS